MKSTLSCCFVCLALTACLTKSNMNPGVIRPSASPSRFVGDTLVVAVVDRSHAPSYGAAFHSALAGTIRSAFPAAIVIDALADTVPAPKRVQVTATVVRYGPSWGKGRWIGHTGLDVFVFDRRVSPANRFVRLIRTSSTSGIVHAGNKTIGDVSRASFDLANAAMVAFLDSIDDPATSEALRSTAGVSENEYAPYLVPTGTASLAGRAFITDGGSEHPAAGQPVTLDPATSSARRWYDKFGMICTMFDASASPDDLFRRARRKAVTDAAGNFTFTGLPAGTYLVRTRILWDAPEPTDGLRKITQQYAFVSGAVTLTDGEKKELVLSEAGNSYLRCPSPMRGVGGRPKPDFRY